MGGKFHIFTGGKVGIEEGLTSSHVIGNRSIAIKRYTKGDHKVFVGKKAAVAN